MHEDEHAAARTGARSAASSRGHGVVSVSSTTSEIDVATRVTMQPPRRQALLREPDVVPEPGAERHDDRRPA